MLTIKASVAAVVLVGTALIAGGAGYYASHAAMTTHVALSCPSLVTTVPGAVIPHSLPNGPTINATNGTTY